MTNMLLIPKGLCHFIMSFSESEIELQLSISAETVDKLSKEVIATMGEWELIGITAKKFELPSTQNGTTYEELRFYVRTHSKHTLKIWIFNLFVMNTTGKTLKIDIFHETNVSSFSF